MTLAVLEGVTFALKNLTEKISVDYNPIKVIGGGMKNSLWKRIFANTFKKKIRDYSTISNAVLGAIRIAQNGYQNVDTLSKDVVVEETELDSDLMPIYEEKYSSYLSAVKHMNQFYG